MPLVEPLASLQRLIQGASSPEEIASLGNSVCFSTLSMRSLDAIWRRAATAYLSSCVSVPLKLRVVRDEAERSGVAVHVVRQIMLFDPEIQEGVLLDSDASTFIEDLHADPEDPAPARLISQWLSPVSGLRFVEPAASSDSFRLTADAPAIERLESFYEAAQCLLRGAPGLEIDLTPARLPVPA